MASVRDNDLLDRWLLSGFGVDAGTHRAALEEIQELRDQLDTIQSETADEAEALRERVRVVLEKAADDADAAFDGTADAADAVDE